MEDSVGGKCEVLYDIKLFENDQPSIMEFEPTLSSNGSRQFIEIIKLKNYNKCKQTGYFCDFSSKSSNIGNNEVATVS
jgi:hypothetical protein